MTEGSGRIISLGNHGDPTVIYVNGLMVTIHGGCKGDPVEGDVDIDIEDGRIVISGAKIVEAEKGLICIEPINTEGPSNDLNVIQSSMDDQVLKVGDVIGEDFIAPEGLERLHNWMVYNVTKEDVPQLLEPKSSAPRNRVDWEAGYKHIKKLKDKGHVYAGMWTMDDYRAIVKNVLRGGFNGKAQLNVHCYPCAYNRYWGDEKELSSRTAEVFFLFNNFELLSSWKEKDLDAYVRAKQDVPELKRFVAPAYEM